MTERQQAIDDLIYIGNLARKFGDDEILHFIIFEYNKINELENGVKLPWE